MALVLHKEPYIVETGVALYRVKATIDGKIAKQSIQCLQSKIDAEIESLMNTRLLAKGYLAEELTPITWE